METPPRKRRSRISLGRDLDDSLAAAQLAQVRRALRSKMVNLPSHEIMIDAIMALSKPLLQMPFEQVLSVAVTKELPAYVDLLFALSTHAIDWDYISPLDMELGDPLAYFRDHKEELKSVIR